MNPIKKTMIFLFAFSGVIVIVGIILGIILGVRHFAICGFAIIPLVLGLMGIPYLRFDESFDKDKNRKTSQWELGEYHRLKKKYGDK